MNHYIQQKQQQILENQTNFYTSTGLHVYLQEPVDGIDVANVISRIEESLPKHFFYNIEMIIFGWFEEFDERSIEAFYDSGTLYVSNIQHDEEDLIENIIHEIAHSLENTYGFEIYGDEKIKNEFLRKRKHLHDMLWASGYKIPASFFMNTEYDQEFDNLLYQKIGYEELDQYVSGLFINSYAVTSLREYFATLFTDYYINSNHNYIKKISPAVYEKIFILQNDEDILDSM